MAVSPDGRLDDNSERPSAPVADRLWPALLDRLTDLEPDRKKESTQARTMSRKAYREGVLRDLQWLLNSTNLDASIDFTGYPDAQRSVLTSAGDFYGGFIGALITSAFFFRRHHFLDGPAFGTLGSLDL